MSKTVKHIAFPMELVQRLEKKASLFGVTFSEYLRHIAINDVMKEVEIADEETEKSIQRSIEDIKNKRYITLKTPEEVMEFFDRGGQKYIKNAKNSSYRRIPKKISKANKK